MHPQHIARIRSSFAWIAPSADVFGELFGANLRTLDPSLSRLLAAEAGAQGRQLMSILRSIIGGLDRPDQLFWTLQSFGRRHAGDGICAEDYDTIGDALMLTLEQCLGERLTPDVAAAWDKTYAALAEVVQFAATPALPLAA
jgi:hemoglobin-like flavoprotein